MRICTLNDDDNNNNIISCWSNLWTSLSCGFLMVLVYHVLAACFCSMLGASSLICYSCLLVHRSSRSHPQAWAPLAFYWDRAASFSAWKEILLYYIWFLLIHDPSLCISPLWTQHLMRGFAFLLLNCSNIYLTPFSAMCLYNGIEITRI